MSQAINETKQNNKLGKSSFVYVDDKQVQEVENKDRKHILYAIENAARQILLTKYNMDFYEEYLTLLG